MLSSFFANWGEITFGPHGCQCPACVWARGSDWTYMGVRHEMMRNEYSNCYGIPLFWKSLCIVYCFDIYVYCHICLNIWLYVSVYIFIVYNYLFIHLSSFKQNHGIHLCTSTKRGLFQPNVEVNYFEVFCQLNGLEQRCQAPWGFGSTRWPGKFESPSVEFHSLCLDFWKGTR